MVTNTKVLIVEQGGVDLEEACEYELKGTNLEFETPVGWTATDLHNAILESITKLDINGRVEVATDPAADYIIFYDATDGLNKKRLISSLKTDVSLNNVDNTSDVDKPVSTAQQTALNLKYDNTNPSSYLNETSHDDLAADNPHSVTKSQVGLSNVPNTDATARASHTGTQTASTISDFESAHDSLPSDNPHSVTKAQVGLGNADNTSDVDKPVSTAQATANTQDRARANHTGTQLSSTISNFASTVLATVLTGLSLASGTIISATDTILVALGSLQNQIINFKNDSFSNYTTANFTTSSTSLVAITSFQLAPTRAGMYNVLAVCSISVNSNQNRVVTSALYKNGVLVPDSTGITGTSNNALNQQITLLAENVTMNGTTDYIEIWISTSGNAITAANRTIALTRVGA